MIKVLSLLVDPCVESRKLIMDTRSNDFYGSERLVSMSIDIGRIWVNKYKNQTKNIYKLKL